MTEPRRAKGDDGRRRATLAIAVGIGLGAVTIAIVLLATLRADDNSKESTAPSLAPPKSAEERRIAKAESELAAAIVPEPTPLPDGDYGPLCTVLLEYQKGFPSDPGFGDVMDLYRKLDFDRILAVAPPGVAPVFEAVRDTRTEVLATWDATKSVADLTVADFPQKWLTNMGQAIRISYVKCVATSPNTGSSAATTTTEG